MNKAPLMIFYLSLLCVPALLLAQAVTGEIVNLSGYAFKYSVRTSASKNTVWQLWTDVENWKTFDISLEYSDLEKNALFGEGAKGFLKAEGVPRVSFEIHDVIDQQSFAVHLNIPLYQSIEQFRYFEIDNTGNTTFTHEVKFKGGLSPLVYMFLQRIYKRETQLVVENIKTLAERQ